MTRIYFAPFHAAMAESSASSCGSTVASFKKAVKLQNWPYDAGDDPSFYAKHKFGGQLTWGICRQDVRNQLSPDDVVVFFSYRKFEDTGDSEYRLCALATVERTVSQIDLWQDKSLKSFTKYFNLLIRPSRSKAGVWEHSEPILEGPRLHHDWLWRIADHRGLRKKDFKKIEKTDRVEPGATIRRHSLIVAPNYVLFSADPKQSYILPKPPVVAWHSKGKAAEEWSSDRFSQAVRQITLHAAAQANGRKRSLRIRNSQRAHRHIVFELPRAGALRWRGEFLNLIRGR
jgi:hypothetical protein